MSTRCGLWGRAVSKWKELALNTYVDFKSHKFKPFLPDNCQVNPGCYGAELAYWLAQRLAEKGVNTSYPNFEDWGWFIEYGTESGDEYWFCCGNEMGSLDKWRCFLDPKKKGLFGKKPEVENARPLLNAVREILESEENISDVHWYNE